MAKNVRSGVSEPTVERWIQEAVSANRLQRVVRGLYLNRLISPPAQLCEAAVWLRPGAVISLQTVLGDVGVWNNFTDWVTAVVPLSRRYTIPSLGRLETAAGIFVFRDLPEAVLEAGREEDRLASGTTYRRATPEAALLHLLYLSNSRRSRMSEPPLDSDLTALDVRKLKRLSQAMRLSEPRWPAGSRKVVNGRNAREGGGHQEYGEYPYRILWCDRNPGRTPTTWTLQSCLSNHPARGLHNLALLENVSCRGHSEMPTEGNAE